ncbi:MAG: hypothetical protein HYX68_23070 [Planctomycetes bacterium]|nr:hypothetical protein [Planctomycetota bacterium]
MNTTGKYEVVFPEWYDERGEWEAKEKGWLQGVEVRFFNGSIHPVFFYDPVRLAQDLETDVKHGRPFVAQPGMVVLSEITRDAILDVVDKLVHEAYFSATAAITKR